MYKTKDPVSGKEVVRLLDEESRVITFKYSDGYSEQIEIPTGVSLTAALKDVENWAVEKCRIWVNGDRRDQIADREIADKSRAAYRSRQARRLLLRPFIARRIA